MSEEIVRQLLVTPEEAKAEIQSRIDALKEISMDQASMLRWYDETEKTLEYVFVSGGGSYLYRNSGFSISENYSTGRRVVEDFNLPRANGILRRLITLIEQYHRTEHPEPGAAGKEVKPGSNNRVFIVHGHDEAAREKVERLLEKVGLEPIVINKKANEGKTAVTPDNSSI